MDRHPPPSLSSGRELRSGASQLIEDVIRERGFDIERVNPVVIVVPTSQRLLGFLSWSGPSVGRAARRICRTPTELRTRLSRTGVPISPLGFYRQQEMDLAWGRFGHGACQVSWPGGDAADDLPVSVGAGDRDAFQEAWRRVLGEQPGSGPGIVCIEEGDRHEVWAVVVGGRVVTWVEGSVREPSDVPVASLDARSDSLAEVANGDHEALGVRAVSSVPGLAYGSVRFSVDRSKVQSDAAAVTVRSVDPDPPPMLITTDLDGARRAAEAIVSLEFASHRRGRWSLAAWQLVRGSRATG